MVYETIQGFVSRSLEICFISRQVMSQLSLQDAFEKQVDLQIIKTYVDAQRCYLKGLIDVFVFITKVRFQFNSNPLSSVFIMIRLKKVLALIRAAIHQSLTTIPNLVILFPDEYNVFQLNRFETTLRSLHDVLGKQAF